MAMRLPMQLGNAKDGDDSTASILGRKMRADYVY